MEYNAVPMFQAYRLGMYGSEYAWIIPGGSDPWWTNSSACAAHELRAAVEGLFLVSSHNSQRGPAQALSGLSNELFAERLGGAGAGRPPSRYAPQAYDAVWAMALALTASERAWNTRNMSIEQFGYARADMANELAARLASVRFQGISGPVSFSGADRIGMYQLFWSQELPKQI